MASVTVPGTNGSISVTQSSGTNLLLAQQFQATLGSIPSNQLFVASITGGGTPPAVPADTTGELVIAGSVGGGIPVPADYTFVVKCRRGSGYDRGRRPVDNLGFGRRDVLRQRGGHRCGGGGNNLILLSGAGYFGAAGDGNDTIFGSGSGTISGGTGANQLSAGLNSTSSSMVFSEGFGDTVAAQAGAVTVAASGTNAAIFDGTATLTVFNTGSGTTVAGGLGTTKT